MSSHDNTLEEIKDRVDIVDLVSEYVSLKKAGQNWKGLCPFHTEKTPSFTVSQAKQIYHCFGCGSGGDIFTFLMNHESLTFPEALKALAAKAGVTIRERQKQSPEKRGERETLQVMHREALAFFRQNLERNPGASKYLSGRGMDRDVQKAFSLGYAPNSWNGLLNHLAGKGYRHDMMKKAGLVVQGQKGVYDTFRHRIIFPIVDLKGDVVAFGGRAMDGTEPKYLNSPETPIFNKRKVLYGLDRAKDVMRKDGYALFMEGYVDVITAHRFGFSSAVAALGTAFTQEHGRLLRRFVDSVLLSFDSDDSGIRAAKKAALILLESGLQVKVLLFPGKEDPDSYLQKNGSAAFQNLIAAPLSVVDFIMRQKGDRRALARESLLTIAKVQDRIQQGEYLRELSEKLGVEERFVREEFDRLKKQDRSGERKPAPENRDRSRPRDLETFIIKLILQTPEKAPDIFTVFSDDLFRDRVTRSLFHKFQTISTDYNDILQQCDREEQNVLTGISLMEEFENPDKVLEDCISKYREGTKKQLVQELDRKIKEAESRKDVRLLNELLMERQQLIRKQ